MRNQKSVVYLYNKIKQIEIMAVAIGMKVVRSGIEGVIVKIITKSTGYVEVDFNGKLKKEMAFNLLDENGVCLKNNKPASTPKKSTMQKEIDYKNSATAKMTADEWEAYRKNIQRNVKSNY